MKGNFDYFTVNVRLTELCQFTCEPVEQREERSVRDNKIGGLRKLSHQNDLLNRWQPARNAANTDRKLFTLPTVHTAELINFDREARAVKNIRYFQFINVAERVGARRGRVASRRAEGLVYAKMARK